MPRIRLAPALLGTAVAALLGCASLLGAGAAAAAEPAVRGRVTDASGQVGFEGALVRIRELDVQVATAADGSFRIPRVAAGTYTLVISYVGAGTLTRSIEVGAAGADLGDVPIGARVARLDNVLVVGEVAGQAAANSRKRAADNVLEVVSADSIGQFPDQNVSEALRRVTGVSIVTEQGEGRFAAVRGIDPNLSSISIAGARVPSPEEDARQVPLDVIPSELLESLELAKTATPDMDGDAIGGAIEIKALSAFDRGDASARLRVEANHNALEERTSPKLSASATRVLDVGGGERNLGVAFAASWFDRRFGWENLETDGGWPLREGPNGTFRSPRASQQQDYRTRLERLGLAASVDFRAAEHTDLYLRALYADVEDRQDRVGTRYRFAAGEPVVLEATRAEFEDGLLDRGFTQRSEERSIESLVAGGSSWSGPWTFDYSAAWSAAREAEPDSLEGDFRAETGIGYAGTGARPFLTPTGDEGFDADQFVLRELAAERTDIDDYERHLQLDARRELTFGGHPGFVKLGGKLRRRDKSADTDITTYDAFGRDVLLSELASARDYALGPLGPVPDGDRLRDFFDAGRNGFDIDAEATLLDSTSLDYAAEEDVDAGYLMGGVDVGPLRVIGGLRVERTEYRARGTRVTIDASDEGEVSLTPFGAAKDYDDLLPGVHLRYELSPAWFGRLAVTRSIARPSFEFIAPAQRIEIETVDGEVERRAELGNPALEPYRSANVDLSFEYYGADELSVLALAAFYKRIDDFIVLTDLAGSGEFVDFDEAITPVNGERATLRGLELTWTKRFGFLPAPWDGLLASANLTLSDGDARLPLAGRSLPLPNQSERVANLVLGYERGALSARLAASYRSKRLLRLDQPDDPAFDVYEDDHVALDLSLKYRFGEHWRVYFDAINLSDRPLYEYYGDAERLHARYERYGRSYRLGLDYVF
jgi:TonB-dependent receptor